MSVVITKSMTVGEIARLRPDLLGLMDRLGLDYCCHGERTLVHACRDAGIDLDATIAALGEAPAKGAGLAEVEPDPAALSMSDLCDDIERRHHAFARESFARLGQMMPRVIVSPRPKGLPIAKTF